MEKFREAQKLVGFISDAVYFAAENGFLNDIKHTGNDLEKLKEALGYTGSANYVLENAMVDQGIVTANDKSPVQFASLIMEELEAAEPKDIKMWSDFYTIGYIDALRKYGFLK